MIAFASLFLGLVLGVVPVKLAVSAQVTRVDVELDGRLAGTLKKPPWSLPVDLGNDLSPHELIARAFDSAGHEIGVVRQWLNLPGPSAKVEVFLDRDEKGRATSARLIWSSIPDIAPTRIVVTFDGESLAADPSGRVVLPAYDPGKAHLLAVDVEFSNAVSSHADLVLGAGPSGEASSELTAVPVISPHGQRMPPAADLDHWFLIDGAHLKVVAVENGPADVLVVRGLDAAAARKSLGSVASIRTGADGFPVQDRRGSPDSVRLRSQDRVRIAWPVARSSVGSVGISELFEQSQAFPGDVGFRWLLTKEYSGPIETELRFAEAVAVAGFRAFSGRSRRAVVLIVGDVPDRSTYTPEMVRGYLSRIRVPLFVWSIDSSATASAWGPAEDISSPAKLEKAVRRLRERLTAQRVVWLSGRYLPQQILISSKARGIQFAE
jgi:hypothetical protein